MWPLVFVGQLAVALCFAEGPASTRWPGPSTSGQSPQVSLIFQIVGGAADAAQTWTPDGAKNATVLALGLVVFTTVINIVGVRLMAK